MSDELLPMLLEQAGRLFGDLVDRPLLIEAEQGRRPDGLWQEIEQFGLLGAFAMGDESLDFASGASLFSLLGYHAVPLPVGETILARALLSRSGLEAPPGPVAIGWSHKERPGLSYSAFADHIIVREGRQLLLLKVARQDRRLASISRLPRAQSNLTSLERVGEGPYPGNLPSPGQLGAMLRASEMAGAIRRVLDMSVDYANVRHQFGRPIGRFQAIQQLLATLAAAGAAAQSSADLAWARLAVGKLGHAHAVAKICAGESARTASAIAHQVHGAIGVTDEHMLHYYTRRLHEWRREFGSDSLWAEHLGREARRVGGSLWEFLTADGAVPSFNEVRP